MAARCLLVSFGICETGVFHHGFGDNMTVSTNPKKINDTLRPLMFVSQLIGITYHAHLLKTRFRVILVYRVILLSVITLALIKEIPSMMFWSRNLKGVHGMLAFIETRLRWFAVFINFLLTIFSNASINNSIVSLINSPLILKQKEYRKIFGYQLWVILSSFLLILFYMILGHDILWINPYYTWYSSTIYIVTEFYIGFANLQFVILLFIIKKYFGALNENLRKCDFKPESSGKGEPFIFFVTKGYQRDNVTEIVKFRQIHMSLTTTCWKTNQCFSLQILLFLVVTLVEVTYSLRGVTVYSIKSDTDDINNWKSKPWLELCLICVWGGYYIFSILQIIYACETTLLESIRTSGVVHELMNKVQDKEVEKQLQIFSLQLMNHKVFFSAGKFVSLSYPLLNSIIGTITTYLIIIMTFSD